LINNVVTVDIVLIVRVVRRRKRRKVGMRRRGSS
jgi:hypothetical protein